MQRIGLNHKDKSYCCQPQCLFIIKLVYNAAVIFIQVVGVNMITDTEYKRVGWHSRRGMLELDLILQPFYRDCLRQLSAEQQQLYIKLLTCEDQDMFRWFLEAEPPQDPEITTIVNLILEHNASLGQ